MKTCSKCKQDKELSEFYKQEKGKYGVRSICKICVKEYDNNHYKNNSEKLKQQTKEWREANPEYVKEWKNQKGKKYFTDYYKNNSEKIIKYINKYNKRKRIEDPLFKLKINLRSRISQSFKNINKSKSTLEILGLTNFEEFKQHIELQFIKGMNWNNYGYGKEKWVIDHKIPLASANSKEDIYTLNHYTNLQPMWWSENMIKGAKINIIL